MFTENNYKRFAKFTGQCINTILSVLKILVQSKFNVKLPSATDDICVVLGNGPSLKQSLEEYKYFLDKHPVICVNSFSVADEFTQLKPSYYVMLDPFFWEGNTEIVLKTFNYLEAKTTWPLYLFVPQYAKNKIVFTELQKKNNNIKVVAFNYTVFKGFPGIAHRLYKKNLAMPQCLNVTVSALFIGLNMGYKEVFLFGADHTWHENLHMSDENVLYTKVPHFFDNETSLKYVPFYKSGNPLMGTQKAHEFFDIWSRTFYAYTQLSNYAMYLGQKIYNASGVSFIDAFERKKP